MFPMQSSRRSSVGLILRYEILKSPSVTGEVNFHRQHQVDDQKAQGDPW
jgi:hypothetical protein